MSKIIIEQLLDALKYHRDQTRPIEKTRVAIEAAEGFLASAQDAQQNVPEGWKLVMVEDNAPADEPDWDEVKRQAEVSTGIPINQPTYSIIIREIRRWLIQRDAIASSQEPDVPQGEPVTLTDNCARRVALSIIEDLESRKGVLDDVDDDVKQEMLDTFAEMIIAALGKKG